MGTEGNVVTREDLLSQGCTEKRTRNGARYLENVVGEIVAKVCIKCSEVIALAEFGKKKKGFGGRMASCKACDSLRCLKYREANTEKVRKRHRKYRKGNAEDVSERGRKWRESNPVKVTEYIRNWTVNNPDKLSLYNQRRRARKASLPDNLTLEQKEAIVTYFNRGCVLTESSDYHMDHALPIKCGHGGTTYGNMIPLRGDLNMSKNDRHIFEWFSANRERFGLSQAKFDALIFYLAEVNGMTTKEYRMYVDWCFDNPRTIGQLNSEVS